MLSTFQGAVPTTGHYLMLCLSNDRFYIICAFIDLILDSSMSTGIDGPFKTNGRDLLPEKKWLGLFYLNLV